MPFEPPRNVPRVAVVACFARLPNQEKWARWEERLSAACRAHVTPLSRKRVAHAADLSLYL